jgi:hypothetical protein
VNGAHCLACGVDGPDLVLAPDPAHKFVLTAAGAVAHIAFTCGRCGARWRWTVTWSPDGPRYSDPQREDH